MTFHVVAAELRRIQDYIFASRRLLDAIGRSAAVNELGAPTADELSRSGGRTLFAGGGSFVAGFTTRDQAEEFAGAYTRRVRDTADLLTVAVAIFTAEDPLGEDFTRIHDELIRARATAEIEHVPITHAGLASRCQVTAGAAEEVTTSGVRGPEMLAASVAADRARARDQHLAWGAAFLDEVPPLADAGTPLAWALPLELDDLSLSVGRDGQPSDEASLLAVIHLDIDALGATLRAYAGTGAGDVAGVSDDLNDLMTQLVRHLCRTVAAAVRWDGAFPVPGLAGEAGGTGVVTGYPQTLTVPLARGQANGQEVLYLPLRPLIVGGDDATIVCDSRVAWSLMRAAHRWWATPTGDLDPADPRRRLTSRGHVFATSTEELDLTLSMGCAFFRRRSPLVTAYERAAALTEIAKKNRNATTLTWDLSGRSPTDLSNDDARQPAGAWLPMEAADLVACTDEWLGPQGHLRGPDASRGYLRRLREASDTELTLELARRPLTIPGSSHMPAIGTPQQLARMLEVFEPLTALDLVVSETTGMEAPE